MKPVCELESAINEVKAISGTLSRHISIATTNPRLLSGILKNFLLENNDVSIHQGFEMSDIREKLVRSGNLDFCLSAPPITGTGIECVILREEEIFLVVPKDHRFTGRASIRLLEVANDPFITLVQNYNYRTVTDSLCRLAGFIPNIAFEIDDPLMGEMMSLGKGIALLPMYIIMQYKNRKMDLVAMSIDEPKCHMKIGLSWLKSRYLSSTAISFRDFMLENYNKSFGLIHNNGRES
jgi:DNA-binding transcriptional LysR family regulator